MDSNSAKAIREDVATLNIVQSWVTSRLATIKHHGEPLPENARAAAKQLQQLVGSYRHG